MPALQAPKGGSIVNNLFVKGGQFQAKPLSRVRRVMQRLRDAARQPVKLSLPDYTNWTPPEPAPPLAARGKTVKLYHYGHLAPDASGRLVVDPEHFGRQKWTQSERKHMAEPKRGFFYADPDKKEMFFEGAPRHVAEYPTEHLYDLTADPDGVVKDHGVHGAVRALRDRGYHGVYYGEHMPVVAIWKPVEVRPDAPARLSRPVDESLTPPEAARVQKMKPVPYAAHRRIIDRALEDRPGMLPTVTEVKGLAHHGEPVRGGYDDAHKLMEALLPHPGDAHRWSAINAVLSANTPWLAHTEGATHVMALWHKAGRPTDAAALNALFGSTHRDEGKLKFAPGTRNVLAHGTKRLVHRLIPPEASHYAMSGLAPQNYYANKAHKIKAILAKGDDYTFDPRDVSDGSLKTPNFALAHFDEHGVPIDTHMAKLLSPKGPADAERRAGKSSLLAAQKRLVTKAPVALAYKTLVSHAAREMGWEPRQVQEAVWTAVLALMVAKKHGAAGDYKSLAAAVHRTAIRAGWDMHTVMRSPQMLQALLHLGGTGEKLYKAVEESRERHPVPQPVRPSTPHPEAVEAGRLPAVVSAAARPIAKALKLSRAGGRHGSFDALLRLALLAASSDDGDHVAKLARKKGGPYERELRPWVASVREMPHDQTRRWAMADWLEENDHHHDGDTLRVLRDHEGPVFIARHRRSGKVVASRPSSWEELMETRRANGRSTQAAPNTPWVLHGAYHGPAGFAFVASHPDEPGHHSVHVVSPDGFRPRPDNSDGHGPEELRDEFPRGPRPLEVAHALAVSRVHGA
jgi:uncharacterized protein (TIGR02996 family)